MLHVSSNAPVTVMPYPTLLCIILGDDAPYTKYHAAMCATMALYEPCFRGFGPSSAELKALTDK